MDRGVAVILMAAVGGLIALQPAINAGLGRATGNIAAALVSFAIGTLVLAAIVVVAGQAGGLRARRSTCAGTTCSAACSAPRTCSPRWSR